MKITFKAKLLAFALGLGISLLGAGNSWAAGTDITFDADTTVTVNGFNLTIISGSTVEAYTVGSANLSFTLASGSAVTVRSADFATLTNSASKAINCTSSYSFVSFNFSDGVGVSITPTGANACPAGGGTGGGGGGGGSPAPTPTPTPTPTVTPTPTPTPVPASNAHSAGAVVKTSDGTVWFITPDGQRRAFTSGGAFLSYGFLSFGQVAAMNAGDNALAAGSFIPPRDGSIFCATETKGTDVKGECALITGGQKSAFTSEAVFKALGFSFANAQYGDSSFLTKTSNTSSGTAQHRPGVLVNNNGTVQLVGTTSLLGIPSMSVLTDWGYSLSSVVPANAADKLLPQSGVMPTRTSGQLNPVGL